MVDWVVSKIKDAGIKVLDINTAYYLPQEVEIKDTKAPQSQILSRKNELINWYFLNSINQRGAVRYNRWYTIDRWCIFSQNTTTYIEVLENGLKCCGGESIEKDARCLAVLEQKLECPERYSERDVTFSVDVIEMNATGINIQIAYMAENDDRIKVAQKLVNTGGIHSLTAKLDSKLKLLSVRILFASSEFGTSNNEYVILKSTKFELGEESTLQQDAPPIYHEELLRCQRYTLKIDHGIIAWPIHIGPYSMCYNISLPCPLRIRPSIYINKYRLYDICTREEIEVGLQCDRLQGNMLYFSAFLSNRKTGDFALVAIGDTVLDAELY